MSDIYTKLKNWGLHTSTLVETKYTVRLINAHIQPNTDNTVWVAIEEHYHDAPSEDLLENSGINTTFSNIEDAIDFCHMFLADTAEKYKAEQLLAEEATLSYIPLFVGKTKEHAQRLGANFDQHGFSVSLKNTVVWVKTTLTEKDVIESVALSRIDIKSDD